ncbi:MAG: late competence development ComFB family protein [Oscillospiraceae bacterium]
MANTPEGQTHYKLVNANEELVQRNVRRQMEQTDMCQCEKCFLDVCAIVFNKGFAHFATTKEGELMAKIPDMNTTYHASLIVAITEAIELVRRSPKH